MTLSVFSCRLIQFSFISSLLLISFSCKKESTQWESDWGLPLVDDTLSLKNLVNDSTLGESPSGFYELNLKRTLLDLNINSVAVIPDTTIQKTFTIFFTWMNVSPGMTFASSVEEHELKLDDVELESIIVKSGFLDIEVLNPVGTKATFNVTLPGVTKNNLVLNEDYEAPSGTAANPGSVIRAVDISGYSFDLKGLDGNKHNRLISQITATSDPNGETVTITKSDTIRLNVSFRDVQLDYARGYFGNSVISDTTTTSIDLMRLIQVGAIDLPNTSLQIEIENGIKVGSQALLTHISNTKLNGTQVSLSNAQIGSSFNVAPATGSWSTLTPSVKTIEFNSTNSNIEAYIENLGNQHEIGYQMNLNPWGNISGGWDEMFPHSKLRINVRVNMPLTIGVDNLVLRDTFAINLQQEQNETHIKSGEFLLKASNSFPLSANIELLLLDANGNMIHTINSTQIIKAAQQGLFDTNKNMFVADSDVTFSIPENVMNDLGSVKQIVVQLSLNTINPATNLSEQMSIPVDAFLSVKLRTKLKVQNNL